MSDIVLNVASVSKRYAVWGSNLRRFASWFNDRVQPEKEFWAIKDVSFTLKKYEALALIGQNGAGKSTLLKLIAGIVKPTHGVVQAKASISAILELGLGFNPEFTGRENIFDAGGMMGLSRRELEKLMPDIEAFSELGPFLDQPLRVYSSGMQARLAFSLATAKRPDLLIVDEVLAVGDTYFQHKSFNRIRQFKEEGSAILYVTHSMGDVRALCNRCILLDRGHVLKDGAPDEVVDYYNALIAMKEDASGHFTQTRNENGWLTTRSGSFDVRSISLKMLDAEKKVPVSTVSVGQDIILSLQVKAEKDIECLILGFMIRDRLGHIIWGSNTSYTSQPVEDVKAGEIIHYEFQFMCELGPGSYSISSALSSSETHLDNNYEWSDNILVFDVVNEKLPFFIGSSYLKSKFIVHRT